MATGISYIHSQNSCMGTVTLLCGNIELGLCYFNRTLHSCLHAHVDIHTLLACSPPTHTTLSSLLPCSPHIHKHPLFTTYPVLFTHTHHPLFTHAFSPLHTPVLFTRASSLHTPVFFAQTSLHSIPRFPCTNLSSLHAPSLHMHLFTTS